SFNIAMICSSLNLLRFILSDSFVSDSTQNRSHFRGARHDLNMIASNVINWSRGQPEALKQRPLAYIDCLLSQMAENGDFTLESLPEEVNGLVPWLALEDCVPLVGLYLDGLKKPA
uniref:hypothetical protein n=1 Tax=Sphingopyxis sp. 2PD TaxID=2502196 RepID=UPI001BB1D944